MKVDVEQEDIDEGVREDSCNCPVAKAISRATGWWTDVMSDGLVLCTAGAEVYRFQLYPEVLAAIKVYDKYGYMSPFSFEMQATR